MAPSKKGSKLKDDVVEDLVKRCQLGDAAGLKEMLAKYGSKLQINEPLHGEYFLLRYAVEKGSVDTVQVLLDHGAEPNLGVTDSYWHYAGMTKADIPGFVKVLQVGPSCSFMC